LDPLNAVLPASAGSVAGVINTLAGGGSLLSVPLLFFLGLPGDVANGTNRVGVLARNATAMRGFQRAGLPGPRLALPVLAAVLPGSWAGAWLTSRLDATAFERLFGLVMVALLIPTLRGGERVIRPVMAVAVVAVAGRRCPRNWFWPAARADLLRHPQTRVPRPALTRGQEPGRALGVTKRVLGRGEILGPALGQAAPLSWARRSRGTSE